MAESVSKAEFEMLAAFRYALRQFLRFSADAADAVGLSPQQHQALLVIKGFPGRDYVTVGELADRLQIRHHSAVGLIDRLVEQELVIRSPAAEDRRQVFVTVTAKGVDLLEELAWAHRQELQRIGPQLHLLLEQLTGRISP